MFEQLQNHICSLENEIERLRAERLKLDRRIHNQRRQLRETWDIVELRQKWLGSPVARRSYARLLKRHRELAAENERLRAELVGRFDQTAEHARLKADNERLRVNGRGWYEQNIDLIKQRDKVWDENKTQREEIERLRAELVDRFDQIAECAKRKAENKHL